MSPRPPFVNRERVLRSLAAEPATADALAARLSANVASVRSALWLLVFCDRVVRCGVDGVYVVGCPGASW